MSFGIVIRMKNKWGIKTPNKGTLRDLETDIEYPFSRPPITSTSEAKVPKWNVELYDGVSFDIAGNEATNVILVRKYKKGSTIGITS